MVPPFAWDVDCSLPDWVFAQLPRLGVTPDGDRGRRIRQFDPSRRRGTPLGKGDQSGGVPTTAFFALHDVRSDMTGFTDALVSLPEAVFADLLESDESYLLVFDLPGVDEDGLEVTIRGTRLTIEALREKDVPEEFWFREEERALFLDVDVPLPQDAAGEQATAALDAGVLEVTIPKASRSETRVPIAG